LHAERKQRDCDQIVRGPVDNISVTNAQPNNRSVCNRSSHFIWVHLTQRAVRVSMKCRLVLVLLNATITPALAQSGPSEAVQRQACMGDALRLCAAYIPDRAQIRDCMAAQLDQLTSQCRAVFDESRKVRRSQPQRSR
jgi:hypothetical protein